MIVYVLIGFLFACLFRHRHNNWLVNAYLFAIVTLVWPFLLLLVVFAFASSQGKHR